MKTSEAGLDLIKSFEGLHLEAYKCPADVVLVGEFECLINAQNRS